MSNNIEFKRLCNNAAKIRKILGEGYYLAEWPLSEGGSKALFLVPNGKLPDKGIYICGL